MEFEDNDEQEDEMGLNEDTGYDSPPPSHHHQPPPGNSSLVKAATVASPEDAAGTAAGGMMVVRSCSSRPRYRECLKNHAVGIGGHAVDGCGEFLAAGADGTIDALKCAACGCHRNFHRKETADPPQHRQTHQALPPPPAFYRLPPPAGYLHHQRPPPPTQPPPLQLALPPPQTASPAAQRAERGEDDNYVGHMDMVEAASGGGRKRFRTKFTAEQKERMLGLAERIGWRIQKQDEVLVQRFCEETGVSRQVLKVWLHNNKHTLGKRQPHHHQETHD